MRVIQEAARKVSGALGRESRFIRTLRPIYENSLDTLSGGRGIPWTINGETYRIDPRCRQQLGEKYDAPVAAFIRERIRPGAVCVDVGANVGVYVLQFSRWTGPNGRVVAFEPNAGAREMLLKHVALNDLSERVTVVPAAVGACSGQETFFAADADGMSRLGAPNELIAERVTEITVPVVTLDEYCTTNDLKPDWILIDIEGFEIAALEGARNLIKRCGRSLNIIVEMHPNVWDSANTTRASAEKLLRELGRQPRALMGQNDPLGDYGLVYLEHEQ